MARVMTSGMVKTEEIGLSAAKLPQRVMPWEKVQRLSGSGLSLDRLGLRYSPTPSRDGPCAKG